MSSGIDQMSVSQEDALQRLKLHLGEHKLGVKRSTASDLLRFLCARGFDVPKAKVIYESMLEWRKEIGPDTIKETFHFPERKALKEIYPLKNAHLKVPSDQALGKIARNKRLKAHEFFFNKFFEQARFGSAVSGTHGSP